MDLFNMMGKIKDVQAKIKEAQSELPGITAEGESGAGLVKVVVNGKKNVVSIDMDDTILTDKVMAQDLIVAAINIGLNNVDEKVKEHMKGKTEGLLPNIPGFDLGGLF